MFYNCGRRVVAKKIVDLVINGGANWSLTKPTTTIRAHVFNYVFHTTFTKGAFVATYHRF